MRKFFSNKNYDEWVIAFRQLIVLVQLLILLFRSLTEVTFWLNFLHEVSSMILVCFNSSKNKGVKKKQKKKYKLPVSANRCL